MTDPLPDLLASIDADPGLSADFAALCDCGGRVCGTDGEAAARAFLAGRLAELGPVRAEPLPHEGWTAVRARVRPAGGEWHPVEALLWSPPGAIVAPVLDLGRGTEAEFEAAADRVAGALVLVRHEYMFAPGHVHRSVKLAAAERLGAAGFLIAGPTRVAGGGAMGGGGTVPCGGIDETTAQALAAAGTAELEIVTRSGPAETENLFLDLPGEGDGLIVLSAHIDGHAPAESALDNASGLAAALAAARALATYPRRLGLRVAFFSLEEWGLEGSRRHLAGLPETERARIRLNVNLDTVAGADGLTALTSDYPHLPPLVTRAGQAAGVEVDSFAPLRRNSDHYNYAVAGIPALRLVAGFGDPHSDVRHVLTAADTREKARPEQLRAAARLAAALVHLAGEAENG